MINTNQKGVTLVELLAVIAISSIVLVVIYSIFFTMLHSANQTSIQAQLRNESVLISQQFDNVMVNTDAIENIGETDANGMFQNFDAIDKQIDDSMQETDVSTSIEIKNGNLLINSKQINSNGYSLQNTTFKFVSGNLQVYFIIDDVKNNQQLNFFKLYHIQSE